MPETWAQNLKRRIEEANASKSVTMALTVLRREHAKGEPEHAGRCYWRRRQIWQLEVTVGLIDKPEPGQGPRIFDGSVTEFDHIYGIGE